MKTRHLRQVLDSQLLKPAKRSEGVEAGCEPVDDLEGHEIGQFADCFPSPVLTGKHAHMRDRQRVWEFGEVE
jgi:methionine aminopeptidase